MLRQMEELAEHSRKAAAAAAAARQREFEILGSGRDRPSKSSPGASQTRGVSWKTLESTRGVQRCMLVCLSLICSLLTARFALMLRCAHLFTRLITCFRAHGKGVYFYESHESFSYSFHQL